MVRHHGETMSMFVKMIARWEFSGESSGIVFPHESPIGESFVRMGKCKKAEHPLGILYYTGDLKE